MNINQIATICHEANRAYCAAIGDTSQVAWENAPEWQRGSAVNGVVYHLGNPDSKPSDSHENWLKEKLADGWKYGPVKDPEAKEHPCCVPYDELPPDQQAKDHLFLAIVRALDPFIDRQAGAQAFNGPDDPTGFGPDHPEWPRKARV